MSDASRISGYGGHGHFAREERGSASLQRFRKGRRVGDVVAGEFLRPEGEQSGWTLLEGEELLALLPATGARPRAGETVYFRIEALSPDVVLRMLPPDDPSAEAARIAGALPLSQQASLYAAARDKLDALLRDHCWPDLADASLSIAERRDVFARFTASRRDALDAYAESLLRSRAIVRAAGVGGPSFYRHMPWLSSVVSRIEVSLWTEEGMPVMASAVTRQGTRLLLQGRFDADTFRYRLELEETPAGASVRPNAFADAAADATASAVATALAPEPGAGRAVCLSVGRKAVVTDVLGYILARTGGSGGHSGAPRSGSLSGGYSRKA